MDIELCIHRALSGMFVALEYLVPFTLQTSCTLQLFYLVIYVSMMTASPSGVSEFAANCARKQTNVRLTKYDGGVNKATPPLPQSSRPNSPFSGLSSQKSPCKTVGSAVLTDILSGRQVSGVDTAKISFSEVRQLTRSSLVLPIYCSRAWLHLCLARNISCSTFPSLRSYLVLLVVPTSNDASKVLYHLDDMALCHTPGFSN